MYQEKEIEEYSPLLVIIIALAGIFLRFYLLDSKGLWLDETFSIWMANHKVGEMLQWAHQIDQHPPLYYLLLHYWIGLFGDTPFYARLLSAVFGAAAVPILYLIGKRIAGVAAGLAAAVFIAFSPFNIFYAQEARMYTLLTFTTAVSIYALVRLMTDPCSRMPIGSQFRHYLRAWWSNEPEPAEANAEKEFSYKDLVRNQPGWRGWVSRHRWLPIKAVETDLTWIAFVVFSAATLLTHNTAVFFLLAINLFVLGLMLFQKKSGQLPAFQAPSLSNWVKAQIGIFILWSPWILFFIQQSIRVDQAFWIPKPSWSAVIQTLRALLNASAPGFGNQVVVWALCALLCLGLLYFRKKLSIFLFLAALFAIPFLGELIVSIRRPIFYDRTLIWITIPLFLVLAAGIAQLRFRLLMIVLVGVLGTNYLFSVGDYYRWFRKEDWNGPAGYVSLFSQKDDLILFNSAMVQIPFDYYFEDYASKKYLEVEKQGVPDMFNRHIPEPRMTNNDVPQLISLLNGRKRVWLVYSHNSYTDPLGLIPQTLVSQMKLVQEREFYGSLVQLYESP